MSVSGRAGGHSLTEESAERVYRGGGRSLIERKSAESVYKGGGAFSDREGIYRELCLEGGRGGHSPIERESRGSVYRGGGAFSG